MKFKDPRNLVERMTEWLFEERDSPVIEYIPHITKRGLECIVDCPRCTAKKQFAKRLAREIEHEAE